MELPKTAKRLEFVNDVKNIYINVYYKKKGNGIKPRTKIIGFTRHYR